LVNQQPDPGRGPGDDRYREGERVRVDPDCDRQRAGQCGVISRAEKDGIPEVDFGGGERSYISDDDLLPA
jgi:hypothetical protein